MPRPPKAQPFGKYHAELGRLLRQMGEDPRIPQSVRAHVAKALDGIQELLLKNQKK